MGNRIMISPISPGHTGVYGVKNMFLIIWWVHLERTLERYITLIQKGDSVYYHTQGNHTTQAPLPYSWPVISDVVNYTSVWFFLDPIYFIVDTNMLNMAKSGTHGENHNSHKTSTPWLLSVLNTGVNITITIPNCIICFGYFNKCIIQQQKIWFFKLFLNDENPLINDIEKWSD